MHLRRSALSLVTVTTISVGTALGVSPVLAGAATAPTVQVQPSTNVADGQVVTVTGSGFTPSETILVLECQAGATGPFNCDINTVQSLFQPTDSNGNFSTPYVATRNIWVNSGWLDCSVPGTCVLGVTDNASLSEFASAPLTFDPTAPPAPILALGATLSPTGTVNHKTGVATVSGTVTCNRPAIVHVGGAVSEPYHHGSSGGAFDTSLLCTSSGTWSAVIKSPNTFTKGTLSVTQATATGSPTYYGTSAQVNLSGPVTLNFSKS
jgi:hypothetical protein